jgi:hypothetical protein
MHTPTHIHTHAHAHTRTHTHTHSHTHTHTHTHTFVLSLTNTSHPVSPQCNLPNLLSHSFHHRMEAEIAAMEAQQGNDVKFINPEPGYVLKTKLVSDGTKVSDALRSPRALRVFE